MHDENVPIDGVVQTQRLSRWDLALPPGALTIIFSRDRFRQNDSMSRFRAEALRSRRRAR